MEALPLKLLDLWPMLKFLKHSKKQPRLKFYKSGSSSKPRLQSKKLWYYAIGLVKSNKNVHYGNPSSSGKSYDQG